MECYIKYLQHDLDRAGATILVIMSEFRKSVKWFASYRGSRRQKYSLSPAELVPIQDELRAQLIAVRKLVRKRKSSGSDIGNYYHSSIICVDVYVVCSDSHRESVNASRWLKTAY